MRPEIIELFLEQKKKLIRFHQYLLIFLNSGYWDVGFKYLNSKPIIEIQLNLSVSNMGVSVCKNVTVLKKLQL